MATFKAVVRTPRKDGFYQVYIRVVHNTKPGYIKTDKVVPGNTGSWQRWTSAPWL